jgi:hypothetical protein
MADVVADNEHHAFGPQGFGGSAQERTTFERREVHEELDHEVEGGSRRVEGPQVGHHPVDLQTLDAEPHDLPWPRRQPRSPHR